MRAWQVEGIRYAVAGLLSNTLLYFGYLGLTTAGLGPKVSMTVLFLLGTAQTFAVNRTWTFRHAGPIPRGVGRYFVAYIGCYMLNFLLLYILVDRLGLPHSVIQGFAIFGIAALLFVIQRLWIFRSDDRPGGEVVRSS